jgi:hypothetical protein
MSITVTFDCTENCYYYTVLLRCQFSIANHETGSMVAQSE